MNADEIDYFLLHDDVMWKATSWPVAAALEGITDAPSDAGAQVALARAALAPASHAAPVGFDGQFIGAERRPPKWRGWVEQDTRVSELTAALASLYLARSTWQRGPVQVVSVLAIFNAALGPEWKVALRRVNRDRPKAPDVDRTLRDFDMRGAFENNPFPSGWRTFYRSVDAARPRAALPTNGRVITEPDGYQWSTPVDGPCRGCVHKYATGEPCPLHGNLPAVLAKGPTP